MNDKIAELRARQSELKLELIELDGQIAEMVLADRRKNQTPLTHESLVAWAQDRVGQAPQWFDRVWDEEKAVYERCVVPNSRERVLRELLKQIVHVSYRDYDNAYELIEEIVDLFDEGVKRPYSQMTEKELLDEIFEQIKGYETMTVEELIDEFEDDDDE